MKTSALSFTSSVVAAFTVFFKFPPDSRKPNKNRSGSEKLKASRKTAAKPRNPYRATSIIYDDSACDAVKAIGKKRFLDRDRTTPELPLPDCTTFQCNCKYAYHEDRRVPHEDRRQLSTLQSELYDRAGKPNRRQRKRGRRKSDWV